MPLVALVRMWTGAAAQLHQPTSDLTGSIFCQPSLAYPQNSVSEPMPDTSSYSKRSQGAGDKRHTSFTRKKNFKIEPRRQLPEEKAGKLMSSILEQISVKTNKPYNTSFGIFCTILLSISCKSYQGIGCLFSHK